MLVGPGGRGRGWTAVEQLITRRSLVQIQPPPPSKTPVERPLRSLRGGLFHDLITPACQQTASTSAGGLIFAAERWPARRQTVWPPAVSLPPRATTAGE